MQIDPRILEQASKVTGKRPRAVIDHIIKHGQVTTEELKDQYGYNHPPRAARDVRECGVPLKTVRVLGSDGRKIGAYTFGDPDEVEGHKLEGRKTFSKAFKERLIEKHGSIDAISGERYPPRYLSIDHRIPYEVAGDSVASEHDEDAFMLISGATQRQKSWSCEHCPNLLGPKSKSVCQSCYWASPEEFEHIATEQRRRVTVTWVGEELQEYKLLENQAENLGVSVGTLITDLLKDAAVRYSKSKG